MSSFASYNDARIALLQLRVRDGIGQCDSLKEAAGAWTNLLYREFRESIVLVRTYATFPFSQLPSHYAGFAQEVAKAKGSGERLCPNTPVLSLLATAGVEAPWNDVRKSDGHLALPLAGADFVEGIPMVARLFSDMGLGLTWTDLGDTDIVVQTLGRIAGLFYVADARTDVDRKRRRIVPATDFVDKYEVRTVFGVGGAYVTGTFLTLIFFTRESLTKAQVEGFQALIHTIKSETVRFSLSGRIFQ